MKRLLILLLSTLTLSLSAHEVNLSGNGWSAMLDPEAKWQDDKLYLPEELPELSTLPINAPSGGWEILESGGRDVSVPLTIDEYFLEGINTNTYKGVSWVWRTFEAPDQLENRVVLLHIAKARMRAEVYINHKLAAYDIVGETPFQFDVTEYITPNATNQIAIRLTNPGGRRGWYDSPNLRWGEYYYTSNGRNFSTLGDVTLWVREKVYVDDIFVKNLLPANGRKVSVEVEVVNNEKEGVEKSIQFSITSDATGKKIASHKVAKSLEVGRNRFSFEMTLSRAELWTPETPNLYNMSADIGVDRKNVRFGVRTFEVKPGESGGHNYYLNGKRFIFRSAIDWGFYTPTGDYATPELAEKSVDAAKAMRQNGLSFHRTIGEPLVMKYADEKGLCIHEEVGGFRPVNGETILDSVSFTLHHVKEKLRRMVVRDRNHPSVITYCLSNENNAFPLARQEALRLVHSLDNSRLIVNTSGPQDESYEIPHFRPYESEMRWDNYDLHTAENQSAIYDDVEFNQERHRTEQYSEGTYLLGEVNSVSGPLNWYKTYEDIKSSGKPGYDTNIFKENHDKIADGFERWNLSDGSGNINSPDDVSRQAGRGMMYAHARHAQSILCNNIAEGYALNGWSDGSYCGETDWSSAILDEGRNIKGPAELFAYWSRPLQIALSRSNGKYFRTNEEVVMEANLINHGVLGRGDYTLCYTIDNTDFSETYNVKVEGGDCYAQPLDSLRFTTQSDWKAGYITLRAELKQGDRVVADGSEQILLQNRQSYKEELSKLNIEVRQWEGAEAALKDAGVELAEVNGTADIIVIGSLDVASFIGSEPYIKEWWQITPILARVKQGATLILRFDEQWADVLHYTEILSKEVTEWGGNQTRWWFGNGWGYLDHFVGYDSTASSGTIGTTSWEVSGDPIGFYPFESDYKLTAHGLYMCRPWSGKTPPIGYRRREVQPTLAVTLATIEYGEGRIILNPCYHVDEDNAFTDMLFYNLITAF